MAVPHFQGLGCRDSQTYKLFREYKVRLKSLFRIQGKKRSSCSSLNSPRQQCPKIRSKTLFRTKGKSVLPEVTSILHGSSAVPHFQGLGCRHSQTYKLFREYKVRLKSLFRIQGKSRSSCSSLNSPRQQCPKIRSTKFFISNSRKIA